MGMMWLVPFERLGEVERLLEEYREKYDERLEYGHERLREAITESGIAQFVKKDALREGKAYGTIGYSAGATAIRGGQQLRNHGEIYLYKWMWNGKEFVQEDAWGGIHIKGRLPEPVIELS